MKKVHIEIFLSVVFVGASTVFMYDKLVGFNQFWNSQIFWSTLLSFGWLMVSLGYFHQGYLVHHSKNANGVSVILPFVVFFVQCILFVKGVYYSDWSLIVGAIVVNSGVVFNLYNILKVKFKKR